MISRGGFISGIIVFQTTNTAHEPLVVKIQPMKRAQGSPVAGLFNNQSGPRGIRTMIVVGFQTMNRVHESLFIVVEIEVLPEGRGNSLRPVISRPTCEK